MNATCEVWTKNGCIRVGMSAVDATSTILSAHGFYDLDVDPGVNTVKLTARSSKATVTVTGKNLTQACERLIERIL